MLWEELVRLWIIKLFHLFRVLCGYLLLLWRRVVPNKILFITTRGSYNCNPRAIADEIIRQNLPWELVWVIQRGDQKQLEQFPPELKLVVRGSYEFYRELVTAHIWMDNSINVFYLYPYKRKKQILFETWHGSIGLKRFETSSNKRWVRRAIACGKQTDYCISNSTFETDLFCSTFWKSVQILEYGHARNDVLFSGDIEKKRIMDQHIRKRYCIPKDVKMALYAPTFRDDGMLDVYELDYDALKFALETRFGGTWYILCRFHFETIRRLKNQIKQLKFSDFVINVSDYGDIQDFLCVCNVGLTDYSSWICDFVLTKRPAFIFATDLMNYYLERDLYYPLETTPFPVARNNIELVENILTFNTESYRTACETFIASKGCIDDGHAAERVVKKLKEIIEEKKR